MSLPSQKLVACSPFLVFHLDGPSDWLVCNKQSAGHLQSLVIEVPVVLVLAEGPTSEEVLPPHAKLLVLRVGG